MICVRRYTRAEVEVWIPDFISRSDAWFEQNPKRKICKIAWPDGRSIDLPRDREARLAKIQRKLKKLP